MTIRTSCIASAAAVMLAIFSTDAGAAVIFTDDFTRTDHITRDVGNGWSELENSSNDVSVLSNKLLLRDVLGGDGPDAAASSMVIDATGYENISVEFKWRAQQQNTVTDDLFLSWALDPAPAMDDLTAWTHVFQGNGAGKSFRVSNVALSGAENTLFNLMLWTISSTKDQGYQIDYVTVTGDEIPPVPLPAGLPLLAGGLAAFGLLRRKRKQA